MPSGLDSKPSQNLKDAVKRVAPHFHLCAATGRSWDVAAPVLQGLGLTDPCIIGGGTQIVHPLQEEIIWQSTISPASLGLIARVATEFGHMVAYSRGFETKKDQDPKLLAQLESVNVVYILGVPHKQIEPMQAKLAADPNITSSLADSWKLKDAGVDFHITGSTATKEHAVHGLCRILGISAAETVGVGDGHNDLHLFNAVGRKVAMGNAVPELKAAADEVIGSVDDDGFAKYLSRLQP